MNFYKAIVFERMFWYDIPIVYLLNFFTKYMGLQRVGNLIIWIIDAHGHPHPHLSYESKTMYFAIDFLAKTLAEGGDTERLKPLYILFSEFWHEKAALVVQDPACLSDADPHALRHGKFQL